MTGVQISKEKFKDARVTIMGLGLHGGGVGATRFFSDLGARVTVTDLRGKRILSPSLKLLEDLDIEYVLGRHIKRHFEGADMVVVNPAVPDDSPYVQAARSAGIRIESVLNFFLNHCPCRVIGVTGSNGKSTTVKLLDQMLRQEGLKPYVGGNLGGDILNWLFELKPEDLVVLEVSSFQLKALQETTPSPRISVLTNLAPNHLDRHGTLEDYYASKARIFGGMNPPRHGVVNAADPEVQRLVSEYSGECLPFDAYHRLENGLWVKDRWVCFRYKGLEGRLFSLSDLKLPGKFNLENAMAAAGAALLEGCSPSAIRKAVQNFVGLSHRLEYVGKWREIAVFNDSKSTNPTSTIRAVEALPSPVLVILGGSDKNLDLEDLAREMCQRAKAVICYGQAGNRIYRAIAEMRGTDEKPLLLWVKPFDRAVDRALVMAAPGDHVVLSPAFASFDQFHSFEERGEVFVGQVQTWGEKGELNIK